MGSLLNAIHGTRAARKAHDGNPPAGAQTTLEAAVCVLLYPIPERVAIGLTWGIAPGGEKAGKTPEGKKIEERNMGERKMNYKKEEKEKELELLGLWIVLPPLIFLSRIFLSLSSS